MCIVLRFPGGVGEDRVGHLIFVFRNVSNVMWDVKSAAVFVFLVCCKLAHYRGAKKIKNPLTVDCGIGWSS
ncbi:hypothetical protein RIF29_27602 [Crotalaria pallida]|uniref:Uncharacterized protein n=1 Tax=Crotalaria pallida TaxID=3830 RepID=A0AAN9HYW8_CROPI